MNKNKATSWNDYMDEYLQDNDEAAAFLEAALENYREDGESMYLMQAIEQVAKSRGGLSKLALQTQLNRQNLYKIFTNKTSPRLDTLSKILRALGLTISVVPCNTKPCVNF